MIGGYKVITLCGSARFKDTFVKVQRKLSLQGNIVLSIVLFEHDTDYEKLDRATKEMLDDMHKRKIDMADEIFVINVGGYIGESTWSEIEYAQRTGKEINFLEDINKQKPNAEPRLKARKGRLQMHCPLIDSTIDSDLCVDVQACIEGDIPVSLELEDFLLDEDYEKVCAECKYHI